MLYGCYYQPYRPREPVHALVATRSPTVYLVRTLCVGCFGAHELATSDWLSPWKFSHFFGFCLFWKSAAVKARDRGIPILNL